MEDRQLKRSDCERCPRIAVLITDHAVLKTEVGTMGQWQKTWDGRIWAIVGATVLNLLVAVGTLSVLLMKNAAALAAVTK